VLHQALVASALLRVACLRIWGRRPSGSCPFLLWKDGELAANAPFGPAWQRFGAIVAISILSGLHRHDARI